jgi:hypothetical protein
LLWDFFIVTFEQERDRSHVWTCTRIFLCHPTMLPPKVSRYRHLSIGLSCGSQRKFLEDCISSCRSQWPRGLRHELSSLARMLGSWVRIPFKAWMSVGFYSVFVLSCVQVARLYDRPILRPRSPIVCVKKITKLKKRERGQDPTKGCRAIDE